MKRILQAMCLAMTLGINPNPAFAVEGAASQELSKKVKEGPLKISQVMYRQETDQLVIEGKAKQPTNLIVSDALLGIELASTDITREISLNLDLLGNSVPCSIQIATADNAITISVENAPENCSKFEKTLTGLVTDGPIPFATVSVTINGTTFTTQADEFGQYSLPIASSSLESLVKVEASGTDPETSTPIEFVNFTGTFERVIEDEPENVTNVTTASFILAVEANDGTEPTTLAELQAAETAIDANKLFELAAVIKLLVDDPNYTLPEGYDNILDFAADGAAVATFVAEAGSAAIDAAIAEILADSDLVVGFKETNIPDRYFAVPTANPGYLARRGGIFEFDATDFTGSILAFNSFSGTPIEQTFTWSVEQGRLVIEYDLPVVQSFFFDIEETTATPEEIAAFKQALDTSQVLGNIETLRTTYTRVNDGTLVDTVAKEDVRRLTWPDVVLPNNQTIIFAPREEITSAVADTLRSNDKIQPIPLIASCDALQANSECVEGVWGGSFQYAPGEYFRGGTYPESNWGDVMNFNANGTVTGVISDITSNWRVENDSLLINYANGTEQRITLVDNIGLEYGVLNEYQTPTGRFATYDIFVKGDQQFSFTEEYVTSPPGKHWNGDVNTWIPGSLNEDGTRPLLSFFGWQLEFDGTGRNIYGSRFDSNGDGIDDNNLVFRANEWSLEANRLKIDRFLSPERSSFDRYWYPIASTVIDGQRVMYVMEVEHRFDGLLFPARLNIQREIDLRNDLDFEVELQLK
ncbi:MAG: hypothetical protein ACI9P7_002383 [Candidatus Azotimanducaceae bacterium]|jgi:hypothetical protein